MNILFTSAGARILLLIANLLFGTAGISEAGELSDGPRIEVFAPKDNMVQTAPFDVDVHFEQRGSALIDLASLKVFLMKLWDIDITERVRPYASSNGIHITHADFPKGLHTIKIAIADVAGHVSSRTLTVQVQ